MRLLLVAALLASSLAGCADLGSTDGPALASAQQALGPADRAAEQWDAGAQLLGASAIEMDEQARQEAKDELDEEFDGLREEHDDGDLSDEEYAELTQLFDSFRRIVETPDSAPGDGRAAVWYFVYLNGAGTSLYTIAVSQGKVLLGQQDGDAAEEFGGDGFYGVLADWRIDSDDAAEAGQLANPEYSMLCDADNIVAFSSLMQGETGPVWFIGAERQADGTPDEAFFAVDANTGSLVQDEVTDVIDDLVFQESGMDDGRFTGAAQAGMTVPFEIEDDRHMALAVHMSVSPAPLQPVEVTVTDPQGMQGSFTIVAGEAPFFAEGSVFMASPPGTYEVRIEVPLALTMSYDLSWCTDGVPTSEGEFQPPACSLMEGTATGGETLSRLGSWVLPW